MMKPKRYGKVRRRAARFQGLLKVGTGLTLAFTLAMLSGCPFIPQGECTTSEDCADTPDTPLCLVDEANAANNECVACLTDADCSQGICAQGQGYVCVECIADADCDDGDLCTTDVCDAATCTFTAVECAADEFCDAATGECVAIECEGDADCDDGVFCNGAETCVDLLCEDGTDPCPGQICVEADGACVDCLADEDCPDDGAFCTGTESCDLDTNTCVSSGDPCAEGEICNEDTDTCDFEGCVEDADCDDGDLCTDDTCLDDGTCENTPVQCPQGQSCNPANGNCEDITCTSNADCDDGASCTQDVCLISTGECIYTANDAACDDGLYCTGVGGVCEPNDPDVADDGTGCVRPGNPCFGTTPVCNESTDSCQACGSDADCDDGVECTDDTCLGTGACTNAPNNAFCDDGLYCTGVEVCDLEDGCESPGNPCSGTTPICDEGTDTCKACTANADCNDDVPCTDDVCNGVTGECSNTEDDTFCSDADTIFCDGEDICDPEDPDADGNGCVGPGTPCTDPLFPICNEATETCLKCAANSDCDDDVACTVDTCNGTTGACDNDPDDDLCPGPGDPASATLCDADLGCVECLIDGDCPDDGLFCTGDPDCVDGSCGFTGDPCSDPTPVCDDDLNDCYECGVDGDCAAPTPRCLVPPDGVCVECLGDADCTAPDTCNLVTNVCE